MSGGIKKLLFVAVGIVAFLVIAAVAAVFLVDVNSYKPKIEAAAHDATGLELKINGKISLSFMPLGVTVNDLHISNKQGQIVGLKKMNIGVELMPLFKKEVKVSRCDLVNPLINIVKDTNGKFNYEETDKDTAKKEEKKPAKDPKSAALAAFIVESFNVIDGSLVYLDKKTGDKIELRDFNLSIKNFDMGHSGGDMIKQLEFTGTFSAKALQQKKLVISDIKSSIKAEKGIFSLPEISMEAFGGKGTGDLKVDMSGSLAGIKLDFKLAKFNLEKLEDSFGQKRNLGGNADMDVAITAHGKEQHQLTSSLNGTFSIRGENLIIYTMDIDKKLGTLEGKPSLGLFDMSTVFGLDAMFGAGKQQKTEQGAIKKMVSDWKITNGISDASDVAIATVKHRIALKGKLDLINERYINIVPAVIDDKGCAKLKQTFNGPFKSPKVETRDVVQTAFTAVEKYGGMFGLKTKKQQDKPAQEAKCDMFYSGSVQAPK